MKSIRVISESRRDSAWSRKDDGRRARTGKWQMAIVCGSLAVERQAVRSRSKTTKLNGSWCTVGAIEAWEGSNVNCSSG